MANLTITNTATTAGVYEGAPMNLAAADAAVVVLVEDITMTIEAAKTRWADKLPNEYTVTIEVAAGGSPLDLDENSVITFTTDKFDDSVTIDETSVAVSGNTATGIAVADNVLTLNLTSAISDTEPTIITFEVNKA